MEILWLVPAGIAAGALSTVAGLGGGILLVLGLSLARDPHGALAITAPGLLLGNAHRLWLYRRQLDWPTAKAFLLGAFPGALVASWAAVSLPDLALQVAIMLVTLLALARGLGLWTWTPPRRALTPAGVAAGAVAATSGAGIFVSPLLLASGLRGDAFIATAAASATAIHVGRILGYGAGGLLDRETLAASAVLAVALVLGNLAGRAIRARMSEKTGERLTYATLLVAVALALIGVAH